jgi:hypothetical protein
MDAKDFSISMENSVNEVTGVSGDGGNISGKKNESIFNYLSLTPLSDV